DLRLEPLAVALVARYEDVGEKLHLDTDLALALGRFAPAARDVEREVARGESARPRVFRRGKQLADRIEGLEIRNGIAARRPADRRLVDQDDVGDVFRAFELSECADTAIPTALHALDRRVEDIVHER